MDLYHWPSPEGNFGDDLNLWLWDFLLPGFRDVKTDDLLVGVGTVLDTALLPGERKKIVIGSGTGYGKTPNVSRSTLWDIRCVRGPLTAKALGLPYEKGILDPAAMIPDMDEFKNLDKQDYGTVFVPHWESALFGQWEQVCDDAGIAYIDSCGNAQEVISAIAQSTLVIAESMHAAIIADAFRVPWIPVSTSAQINPFKWSDWSGSLNMEYQPYALPVSSPLEAGAKGQPYLGMRWPKNNPVITEVPAIAGMDRQGAEVLASGDLNTSAKGYVKKLLSSQMASSVFRKPAIYQLKKALKAPPQLSAESIYIRQKSRFYEVIDQVKYDYGL